MQARANTSQRIWTLDARHMLITYNNRMRGISKTRNHHAVISMTGGTCQQEHTGTRPHTHNLNCFPSIVRSASVGAARIFCCTLSLCTEQAAHRKSYTPHYRLRTD